MSNAANPHGHGAPHAAPVKPDWWERADRIRQELLKMPDVRQLTVFGRHGYFVRNFLFASIPLSEPRLDVWLRMPDADRQKVERHALALPHPHAMPGWSNLEVREDGHVAVALEFLKTAYEAACQRASKGGRDDVGVPIETVPESPATPGHKIPQGPRSGRFKTGLDIPGATPQGPPAGKK